MHADDLWRYLVAYGVIFALFAATILIAGALGAVLFVAGFMLSRLTRH